MFQGYVGKLLDLGLTKVYIEVYLSSQISYDFRVSM